MADDKQPRFKNEQAKEEADLEVKQEEADEVKGGVEKDAGYVRHAPDADPFRRAPGRNPRT
jgi:hypothetical protein